MFRAMYLCKHFANVLPLLVHFANPSVTSHKQEHTKNGILLTHLLMLKCYICLSFLYKFTGFCKLLLFIDFEYEYMFSMCELSAISYISHLPGVIRIEISWGVQSLPIP